MIRVVSFHSHFFLHFLFAITFLLDLFVGIISSTVAFRWPFCWYHFLRHIFHHCFSICVFIEFSLSLAHSFYYRSRENTEWNVFRPIGWHPSIVRRLFSFYLHMLFSLSYFSLGSTHGSQTLHWNISSNKNRVQRRKYVA